MALYIGSIKSDIVLNNEKVSLKTYVIDSKLKSSDEYILKDEENLYLTSKEGEQ